MTISKLRPLGFSANEIVTSADFNQLDNNMAAALDRRDGYTDILSSNIDVDGIIDIELGGELNVKLGAELNLKSSGTMNVGAASVVNVDASAVVLASFGATSSFTLNTATSVDYASPKVISVHQSAYGGLSTNLSFIQTGVGANTGSGWLPDGYGGYFLTSNLDAVELRMPVRKPINGATLSNVLLYYKPRAIVAISPPTYRIRVDVLRQQLGVPGTMQSLFSTGQQEVAAYAATAWTSSNWNTNQNNVVDTGTYEYFIRIQEENGPSAVYGSSISGVRLQYSVTDILTAAI